MQNWTVTQTQHFMVRMMILIIFWFLERPTRFEVQKISRDLISKQSMAKKIIGFSAVRLPAHGNSCGDHTVTYTTATTNTDQMLSLPTGIFTVSRPGIYLLNFQAISTYDSKLTGVHMLKKSTTHSALLGTSVQKGPTPMSMLNLVQLNRNDQVSIWFWSETPGRGCLYSGINNQTIVTTFSAILLNDAVNWFYNTYIRGFIDSKLANKLLDIIERVCLSWYWFCKNKWKFYLVGLLATV